MLLWDSEEVVVVWTTKEAGVCGGCRAGGEGLAAVKRVEDGCGWREREGRTSDRPR